MAINILPSLVVYFFLVIIHFTEYYLNKYAAVIDCHEILAGR